MATDVLMTIFSDSTYHLMTTERKWSHDQVIDWLCAALPELLLEKEVGLRQADDRART
jgi:hypothetical protein